MSGSRQRGGLPALAWAVLASTAAAAAACLAVVLARYGALGIRPPALFAALTALVAISWIWPIMMYSEGSSQAHHLDEGFFVVLVLVATPLGTLAAFLAAALAGQLLRRRPAVKTVFNVALVVVSAGAGLAVVRLLAPPHARLGAASLAAAVLGAAVYFVVNSALVAGILAASGAERLPAALLDGIAVRALLLAASVAMGLVAALAASAYPVAGVLVVLPFLAFRQTLAGHFQARNDRARLRVLYEDQERLEYHAFHDLLTGLPNRRIFLDRLGHALRRAERTGEVHAVLFVDVDRLKTTNDSLGHQTGDELLVGMAERLRRVTREGDTVARFGGDEFTLLLEDIGGAEQAEAAARRVIDAVNAPLPVGGTRTISASASVGVALASGGASPDGVLHAADAAMYQVKRRGGGAFERFEGELPPAATGAAALEPALRRAVEQRQLVVHYQPIVSTTSDDVLGAEALVRWDHPELGLVPPERFIGLAERTGLILPIGRQVLEEACRQAREWTTEHPGRPFMLAVNLSARQFRRPDQAQEIRAVLEATGLPPAHLCVEVAEGVATSDVERAREALAELKGVGVHLAIDGFGTGRASIDRLRALPVDVVKIGRGSVQDLEAEPAGALVPAVVEVAQAMGARVVAVGVETAGQLARLAALGCPLAQGFHLAQPMPAAELTRFLRGRRSGPAGLPPAAGGPAPGAELPRPAPRDDGFPGTHRLAPAS